MTTDVTRSHFLADVIWRQLNMHMADDRTITAATVAQWLEHHTAGAPTTPLMQETIRDDAKLWADCASPAELEAYTVAAITALEKSVLTEKAAKRATAFGWQQMSPTSREAFKAWINKDQKQDG